jgi:hypothetical protein
MSNTAKPRAKSPKLTVKQAKLINGIIAGKTKRQAAKDAGYSGNPESLSAGASQVLKKVNVQEAMMEAMTRAGIDADLLAGTIKRGLTATKGVIVRDPGAVDSDESANSAFYEEVPDHAIRHRFLETSLKIAGVVTADAGNITNNFLFIQANDRDEFQI